MNGRSRGWVLAIALALAACASDVPSNELTPTTFPPAAPEGLLVGVAVVARPADVEALFAYDPRMSLSFNQDNGRPGDFAFMVRNLSRIDRLSLSTADGGMPVLLRPFALRLKGGRGEFYQFNLTQSFSVERKYYTYGREDPYTRQREMVKNFASANETIVESGSIRPVPFEVEPGKVRYVGRIGVAIFDHQDRWRPDLPRIPCVVTIICRSRTLFLDSDPAADLPLIRKHYPHLAGIEIGVYPLKVRPSD